MRALETARPEDPEKLRFRELYRGEFGFVWSAAQHLGVPSGAVADVVQDVFLTAYRRLDHLCFEVSPRAWLYGVTRRVAFRYRRGAARLARRHAAFAELARPSLRAPQQRHDDAEQLRGLLGQLGEGVRMVWEMTEMLGMSAPEIASELELPVNTVYSRLRLARKQLQEIVADGDRLVAWRDAAREQQAPPRGAEQRAWVLLLPALGKSSAGAGFVAWMAMPQGVATTLIAIGVVVVVGVVVGRAPVRVVPDVPVVDAPRVVPVEVVAVPEVVAEVVTEVVAPVVKDMSQKPGRAAPGSVAEEVAVVDRAQAQLGAGEVAAALVTIAEHERRFPAGVLVDVREAARAEALCRSGHGAAAEAAARRLVQAYPGSAVAQRFENYFCRGDGSVGGAETRG